LDDRQQKQLQMLPLLEMSSAGTGLAQRQQILLQMTQQQQQQQCLTL
jgi:hypothetical protein